MDFEIHLPIRNRMQLPADDLCPQKKLSFMYFHDSGSSFLGSSLPFCCSEHAAQKGPWFFHGFPVFCVL